MNRESKVAEGHESPTAEWVVGVDAFGTQQYIFHTSEPCFLAKVAANEDEGVLSDLSYALNDGRSLYDFVWFDELPGQDALRALLRVADDAVMNAASK